jgi:outer membrane protein OmpA-like peptidoglycan-associated protein
MRRFLPFAALTLAMALVSARAPDALAQSTLDPKALEQLAPAPGTTTPATPPAKPKPAPRPAKPAAKPAPAKPAPAKPAAGKPAVTKPAAPPPPAPAKLPDVIVPTAPPPAPVLPPPIVVPIRPPPPAAPVPVAPDAPGSATADPTGLRVTFGPDRADLNPESEAAIVALAHAPAAAGSTYTVTAYAAGSDDPSTPRRLSLSRALSVRGALMQAGVASVRIYVKALGASSPAIADGPPDRVDIVVTAGQIPADPNPAAPPAPPAPIQKAAP